ncbi:hypothetical protein ACG7TL_008939 [Trametes sanguinea]
MAEDELAPRHNLSGPTKASSYILPRSQAGPGKLDKRQPPDTRPTPEPTGASSSSTTVHIIDEHDFALLLPDRPGELISDAESDGVSYCTPDSTDPACSKRVQDGFIRAAAVTTSDDGSYIQYPFFVALCVYIAPATQALDPGVFDPESVTGCLDVSKSSLDPSDSGGQFDVRFPNGAQCTYGGYGASFIQLVEPAANRFCLRCCRSRDDQINCNSHQDRAGCQTAIPGTYDFPSLGVTCEE